ncbi:Nif3-like dinuclear metal center hexameric protein [Ichthyobacterium seriolicida]|uniref:GTP cyclohydrolase 1 type 2 homolog n=1 Tax=Ichthyobacterium seriolicida TaxID=242600 RepID=A0A1J1E9Z6_9FLAO|nr:Nif3-like dinuclear metal center hexameric protein [Ichthyobacterium seriolicida]BAV94344.1 NGG1p interacting factor 3 protein, NIF3 [Ichthyobacterium seriolicida]
MKIKHIAEKIEQELAPIDYSEDFDNVGLLVGDENKEIDNVLVTLDTTEEVIDEAIDKRCGLIISFHPIIFSGIKKLNGSDYVQRIVVKAIKNDIAIYSVHTNLDNSILGVNHKICKVLAIENTQILQPKNRVIKKLVTYVPLEYKQTLLEGLFQSGAGGIGNYENCSFSHEGKGTFKGNKNSNPTVGEKGLQHVEAETCVSVVFPKHIENKILKTLFELHPYEEVAYEVFTLDNYYQNIGMGMIGNLKFPMQENQFLDMLKKKLNVPCIRHSDFLNRKVQKIAVLGGSGSFAISRAKSLKADVFISSDIKYHNFFQAEKNILIVDVGHYESEQFTKDLIVDFLRQNFSTFATHISMERTNPVNYFI